MKQRTHVNFTALAIGATLMLLASLGLKAQVILRKDSSGNYVSAKRITHKEVSQPIGNYSDGKGLTSVLMDRDWET